MKHKACDRSGAAVIALREQGDTHAAAGFAVANGRGYGFALGLPLANSGDDLAGFRDLSAQRIQVDEHVFDVR